MKLFPSMGRAESQPAACPSRLRWYQFTLREMLLAALAFCLLVALFVHPRRSTPTPTFFSERFHREQGQVVQAAFARLGLKSDACAPGMFQRASGTGPRQLIPKLSCSRHLGASREAVVGELNTRNPGEC